MRLLLDTHAFIWWDIEPSPLSPRAFELCQNPDNQLVLSVVSVWEMEIKIQLGKLGFERPLDEMVAEQRRLNGVEILPVTLEHVFEIEKLPLIHRDPFDRLLIAQARVEIVPFISRDKEFSAYPVTVEW
ncbi:MAG: type II toxin-antitoxin system VapC family toxin [Caldilineaceae bacterium]